MQSQAFHVRQGTFEGPLDLLLFLVKRDDNARDMWDSEAIAKD